MYDYDVWKLFEQQYIPYADNSVLREDAYLNVFEMLQLTSTFPS